MCFKDYPKVPFIMKYLMNEFVANITSYQIWSFLLYWRKQKEVQKKELEGHSTIYNINAKTVVIGNENKVINTVNSQSDVEGNYR